MADWEIHQFLDAANHTRYPSEKVPTVHLLGKEFFYKKKNSATVTWSKVAEMRGNGHFFALIGI